jgi:hypothetical protein
MPFNFNEKEREEFNRLAKKRKADSSATTYRKRKSFEKKEVR